MVAGEYSGYYCRAMRRAIAAIAATAGKSQPITLCEDAE
jgi:hypothetical protein